MDDQKGLEYAVHPLTLVNIVDQLNREVALTRADKHHAFRSIDNVTVVGGLLGSLDTRVLSLRNSFELAMLETESHPTADSLVEEDLILDWNFLEDRRKQYGEVFNDLELVGWYIAGSNIRHNMLTQLLLESSKLIENPIVLQVSASVASSSDEVSAQCQYKPKINLFEVQTSREASVSSLFLFEEVPFKMGSIEAERIAVTQILSDGVIPNSTCPLFKTSASGFFTRKEKARGSYITSHSCSPFEAHLQAWCQQADRLKLQIDEAVVFLREVKEQGNNIDSACMARLMELSAVCYAVNRQPGIQNNEDCFKKALNTESTVAALTVASAATLKGILSFTQEDNFFHEDKSSFIEQTYSYDL